LIQALSGRFGRRQRRAMHWGGRNIIRPLAAFLGGRIFRKLGEGLAVFIFSPFLPLQPAGYRWDAS
jgi:hypothetical protein